MEAMGKWDKELEGRRTVRWWGQVVAWQWDFLIQSIKVKITGYRYPAIFWVKVTNPFLSGAKSSVQVLLSIALLANS
jgi:hypothetical protein